MEQATSQDGIRLTSAAVEHVRSYLGRHGGRGLRLGVKRTGCSGWAYVVDVAHEVGPEDVVYTDQGVEIVVDPQARALVAGTEIDYVTVGLNRNFVFRNPNVTDECGCGESFAVNPAGA